MRLANRQRSSVRVSMSRSFLAGVSRACFLPCRVKTRESEAGCRFVYDYLLYPFVFSTFLTFELYDYILLQPTNSSSDFITLLSTALATSLIMANNHTGMFLPIPRQSLFLSYIPNPEPQPLDRALCCLTKHSKKRPMDPLQLKSIASPPLNTATSFNNATKRRTPSPSLQRSTRPLSLLKRNALSAPCTRFPRFTGDDWTNTTATEWICSGATG